MKKILKSLFPFLPLFIVILFLILEPYYIFPAGGDTNFHLLRAREILENPLLSLLWDYLVYYPMGRPLWHPPLFHLIYASLWSLGGVRFAHSAMCILQITLTTFTASWVANKLYGNLAGFFAGFFALAPPLSAPLIIAIPASYLPIMAVLTIYFIPKNTKAAILVSIVAIWTHMVSLFAILPLFIIDGYKNKSSKKAILFLLPFLIFWGSYWFYFKNSLVTGGMLYTLKNLYISTYLTVYGLYNLVIVFSLGLIGLYLIHKIDNRRYRLITGYVIIIILFSFLGFGGDFLRGFQFAALPMAIMASLTVKKGYDFLNQINRRYLGTVFILVMVFISLIGFLIFFSQWSTEEVSWNDLNIPFEKDSNNLKSYIEHNTNKDEVLWAESELAEKVAWMTGRKVSNGRYLGDVYGAIRGFKDKYQRINIYQNNETFLINNIRNQTIFIISKNK
ncbi:MAG: hypothetical protein Kow0019_07930 [Methanobacteriaceae archaeon]